MASNVNPAESLTAKAMDRAIDLVMEGNSPYPEHAAFVDADSPVPGTRSHVRSMRATPQLEAGASREQSASSRGLASLDEPGAYPIPRCRGRAG
jgi:hypothetical protein